MTRDWAIAAIRAHEPELRALGVVQLVLFGSVARNESAAHSDIDVAVTFAPEIRGLSTIGRLRDVAAELTTVLGRTVDVILEPQSPGPLHDAIRREGCLALQ